MENILEVVVAKLQSRKGDWPRIAKETGIPYGTLAKIGGGFTRDPQISNIQKLLEWFESRAAA